MSFNVQSSGVAQSNFQALPPQDAMRTLPAATATAR